MEEDPSVAFFPDSKGKVDLYAVLSVDKKATADEIKRAYRRLALIHHPDKQTPGLSSEQVQAANLKFQQIGYAYAVLKDEKRREKYDTSGRTNESAEGARTESEWKEFFKELWSGEISAQSIDKFKKQYQGSDEEKLDVFDVYTQSGGDLNKLLDSIMCSTHQDEDRLIKIVNDAIAAGELKSTAKWKKSSQDTKGKENRAKKASKEAKEAEKLAQELGVHEKLYGNGKGKGKAADEDGEAGLKALIQGNQKKRMDNLFDSLEAKYGKNKETKSKGKKRQRNWVGPTEAEGSGSKTQKKKKVETEPTEEEFERIQAEIDQRRAKGKKQ